LFEDGATREASGVEAVEEAADAGGVEMGRAGEEREVAVGVAVVFVEMEVEDGDGGVEGVEVTPVVVAEWGEEIGVSEVEGHADGRGVRIGVVAEVSKEAVEVFGAGGDGVFEGEREVGGSGEAEGGFEGLGEGGGSLGWIEVEVEEGGADVLGELDDAEDAGIVGVVEGSKFEWGVDGEFEVVVGGAVADGAAGGVVEVDFGPAAGVGRAAVGEELEGVELVGEGELERFEDGVSGAGGLIADAEVHAL
jgi:hypothetical protein